MGRRSIAIGWVIIAGGSALLGPAGAEPAGDRVSSSEPTASVVELALPDGWPELFTVAVPLDGRVQVLELARHSWRAPGFRVLVTEPSDRLVEVEPSPPRTYLGRIAGMPGSVVVASLGERGLFAQVRDGAGLSLWSVRPLRADGGGTPRAAHLVGPPEPRRAEEPWHPDDGPIWVRDAASAPSSSRNDDLSLRSHPGQTLAEISFDADHEYYLQACNSSRQACIDRIEWIVAQLDETYARDAKVTYAIVEIVVRETPYYNEDGDAGRILDEFCTEWRTNPVYLPRDLVHLMTERNTPGIGGVAYAGCVVCGDFACGLSHDSAGIVAHEVGHNWSLPHCADPVEAPFQGNIMCGAELQIGPNDTDSIHACKTSLACLDDVGPHADPLPPYAYPERSSMRDDELGMLRFDPLANDFDGNDDALALTGADPFSTQHGSASISEGTGPGGRDEIVYTPPAGGYLGVDKLLYEAGDSTGRGRTGLVKIEATTPEIVAYWPLDETTGTVAGDATAFDRDGTLQGLSFDSNSVPGRFGRGLDFGKNNQLVSVGAPDVPPPWTVSLWVKRKNPGTLYSSLLDSSAHSLRLEQWALTSKVGITRYGVADYTFDYTAPIGTFVHLVFVGTETETQLWVNGALVQTLAVSIDAPLGTLSKDGDGGLRAVLDDVRVFNYALDAAGIQRLFDGGKATAPRPRHRDRRASPGEVLAWAPGGEALEHDVYLGTDESAVASANTSSPEYRGRQAGTTFDPDLSVDTTYYWRIDEVLSGGAILAGDVWWFRTVEPLEADLVGHLPFDLTTLDYAGQLAGGSPYGDPQLVPGPIDTALDLDGVGKYLRLPESPNVDPPWTLSMWVMRRASPGGAAYLLDASRSSIRLEQWFGTKKVGITEYGILHHVFDYEAPIGQWVHLVFVGTSAETRLHVDGVFTDVLPVSIPMPRERLGNTNGDLRATVDDVAMWDRELTGAEIQSIHAAGLEGRSFRCSRGVPGEVKRLTLGRESPGSPVAVLSWDEVPGAESYDVHRALSPDLSDLACVLSGIEMTSTLDDGAVPAPGRVYFHVTAAVTCAGSSTLGAGRPPAPTCP